MSKPWNFVKA